MRIFSVAMAFALVLVVAVRGDVPASQPAGVDLKKNTLVQKALADQDKAVAVAEADYAKQLEALNAERQKKLSLARTACVAALRRAGPVSTARNNREEALTIEALANSIAADIAAEPKTPPTSKLVGKWKTNGGGFILEADGTVRSTSAQLTGKWVVNQNGEIELRWPGYLDVFKQIDAGKLKRSDGLEAIRVP